MQKFQHPLLTGLSVFNNWSWDAEAKSECVTLSENNKSAYFFDHPYTISRGTAAVRGNRPFQHGMHYFEIEFKEPIFGSAIMVGVGSEEVCLHYDNYEYCNLIGLDSNSYGLSHKGRVWHKNMSKKFCEPFFDKDTVMGVYVDMIRKKIHFFLNNVYLGVAFTNINTDKPLYPMVSSTSTDQAVHITNTYTIFHTLQDLCCQVICKNCKCKNYDSLPLSKRLIVHLKSIS